MKTSKLEVSDFNFATTGMETKRRNELWTFCEKWNITTEQFKEMMELFSPILEDLSDGSYIDDLKEEVEELKDQINQIKELVRYF